jgi:hypothetical protein
MRPPPSPGPGIGHFRLVPDRLPPPRTHRGHAWTAPFGFWPDPDEHQHDDTFRLEQPARRAGNGPSPEASRTWANRERLAAAETNRCWLCQARQNLPQGRRSQTDDHRESWKWVPLLIRQSLEVRRPIKPAEPSANSAFGTRSVASSMVGMGVCRSSRKSVILG